MATLAEWPFSSHTVLLDPCFHISSTSHQQSFAKPCTALHTIHTHEPASFPVTGYPAQRGGVGGGHSSSGGVGADHSSLPQQRLLAERKWRLGLHVRGHPSALMAELYRVLQVGRVVGFSLFLQAAAPATDGSAAVYKDDMM